ncbi:MAG: SUMF1/EgtB/PvdO family nonheme iron enzyme [Myxococcota bacterium]|nr:SUMF1/EgtB/PvdO family nonheme iron enzyme [Myxococcota bacterium]
MTPDALAAGLNAIEQLVADEKLERLAELASTAIGHQDNGLASTPDLNRLRSLLSSAIFEDGAKIGNRVLIGELLGNLGDPRLHSPEDSEYWVPVTLQSGTVLNVGRHPVSCKEFCQFIADDSYNDDAAWTPDSLGWKRLGRRTWSDLAAVVPESLLIPNQPVVGTNWYEAMAYAKHAGARLPTVHERLQIARGVEKRPYPWGDPFGHGNANTVEEVVGRPCAVGLFQNDQTPEGVMDLAGNVAEWLQDSVGDQRLIHPGSWKQPSMASWAKARSIEKPTYREDDLGFRLVRD